MTRGKLTLAVICTLALAPALAGCVGVAVVGGLAAAGGAGYEAAQERGVNGTYEDFKVKSDITNALRNQYGAVNTTVYQGRVLLTGTSPSPMQKSQAEQVASRVPGVRTVYNEIEVAAVEDPWQTAKDGWITARIKSDMVLDPDVRSSNYTIETDRQSVFLIGSARSQYELDRATQIARFVPGVQRVVSYIEIRTGIPNGAAPPGPSQAATPYPGSATPYSSPYSGGNTTRPSGPSPSNAPIQVQKL